MPNFDAGLYGFFVWTSYGVSVLVLVALLIDSLWRARRWARLAQGAKADGDGGERP